MSKKFDLAIFIGRMQPFHNGHLENIKKASEIADKVMVVFGSTNKAIDSKNPFSFNWRLGMAVCGMTESGIVPGSNLMTVAMDDQPSNDLWVAGIQDHARRILGTLEDKRIAVVGHRKDDSSFYLDLFSPWELVSVDGLTDDEEVISATKIREALFEGKLDSVRHMMPNSVYELVEVWDNTIFGKEMREDYFFHKEYPEKRRAKYPINDVTADAVVICSGHILLIRRKNIPGKGLLALPGGFVQTDETVLDGAVRELLEETKLHVPEKVIRGSIVDEKRFDDPNRSLRGRLMTFAFTIKLSPNPDGKLPRVYGSDDADKAFWVPIADIKNPERASEFFEDHWQIIMTMIGRAVK